MPVEVADFDEIEIDPVEKKLEEIILQEIEFKFCIDFLNRIEDSNTKDYALDNFRLYVGSLITQVPLSAAISDPKQGIVTKIEDFDNPETLKILRNTIREEQEQMFIDLTDEHEEIDEFYALGLMSTFISRFSDPNILDVSLRGSIEDRVLDQACYKIIKAHLNTIPDPSTRSTVTDYYDRTIDTLTAMTELALKDPSYMQPYEDACRNYAKIAAQLGYEHNFLDILSALSAAKNWKDKVEPTDQTLYL